jgi:hypothetical protein
MAKQNFQAWDTQIYTAQDALAPRPNKLYIAKPFFAIPSLSVVYGISGSHKTNIMVDLATCVATGTRWLQGVDSQEIAGWDVTQSAVLWIDQDSGADALHERFGAMLRAHKGNTETPIHYLSFPAPPFTAIDSEAINEVSRRAQQIKARLIVLDNLGTISGGRDENSSEMIQVMNHLRLLSQLAQAAVITIHHDPKNENGQRKTPRGHSSIEAAIDLALWIKREGNVVTMTATKTRGALFDPFAALFTWQHVKDTTTLDTARFFGLGSQRDPKILKTEQIIMDFLVENKTANQQQLVQACMSQTKGQNKIGEPTVISVLSQLVADNKIKRTRGNRTTLVYTL